MIERRDNDFFGSPVNRAARIMGAAHGGQMLVSHAVAELVRDRLPAAYRCVISARCVCATCPGPSASGR